MLRRLLWAGFLASACLGCGGPGHQVDVESRLARARVALAEEQLETDHAKAASTAREILDSSPSDATRARALIVLGVATNSAATLDEAVALLAKLEPGPALWSQRERLAEHELAADRPATALELLERSIAEAEDWIPRAERAKAQAPLQHLCARAFAAMGREDEAFSAERSALLALSQVPDDELRGLRQQVALELALAYANRASYQAAYEQFARASQLARTLQLPHDEYRALAGMSRSLRRLGWPLDAAGHAQRALECGVGWAPKVELEQLGREAIGWLDGFQDKMAATRRDALQQLLSELAESEAG